MNFCSKEQDKTKIISKVFIDEENKNKYTIKYMDGHEETFFDLNDSINDVEELMKKQAIERDELEYLDLHIKKLGSNLVALAACGLNFKASLYQNLLMFICGQIIYFKCFYDYINNSKKICELNKYRILLENYDKLKEKFGDKSVDLFDIDAYSLKEIKALTKSLIKKGDN